MNIMTKDRPKCLVTINGITLLDLQLDSLRSAGISDISIVTGFMRETLECYGLTSYYNPRWSQTEMVSSLSYAGSLLRRHTCIVSYSDIFYQPDIVRALLESDGDICVAYDPNWAELWNKRFKSPLLDAESFKLNSQGYITDIGKKLNHISDADGQYMGLLKFTPNGWHQVQQITSSMGGLLADKLQMTHLLQSLIDSGITCIKGVPCRSTWGEIDTISDFNLYS